MPDMREEFEAWFFKSFRRGLKIEDDLEFDKKSGEYVNNPANSYYKAWQASRAALKVELPDGDQGEVGPRKFVIEEVREALQQAGIKVIEQQRNN